jgi:tRNA pseudouridine55 synthase
MTPFGILNVNKPARMTSRAAVDRVERLVRPAKVGHAGTLDPLATGVLVICVGQATRLIRFVQRMPKQYRTIFLLGRRSDTDDIEGDVVEIQAAPVPARTAVEEVLLRFVGAIEQRPPAHSAIKVAGRRAYQLARQGAELKLAARTVNIHRIMLGRYEYPELELAIECGSGMYVRALGRDIGAALGTGAVMSALERTAIGSFTIEQSISLENLSHDRLLENLQPLRAAVADLPTIGLTDSQRIEIHHGRSIPVPGNGNPLSAAANSEWVAVDSTGRLVAFLREKRPGQLWPEINFK